MTLAQKIEEITRKHLQEGNGLALGQCLTAVGWVAGTVPQLTEADGLVELATSDVSNGGVATGLALAGRRPIYIVRYQGFQWYNAASIVNYAGKSKEMWGVPCPVFVRSIAMEGAIGPVASNSHHSIYTRVPGVLVTAPATPGEYQQIWDHFMTHDDPMYVSEHRRCFPIDYEMPDVIHDEADITIFAISSTRMNAIEAVKELEKEGIVCNLVHLVWLKPFIVEERMKRALSTSKFGGLVLDGDYENGIAKTIAFDIIESVNKPVRVLALEERTAGFAPHLDNLPPTAAKISALVRKITRA
jgi:acetoin:2,6-dichlorophenolindophenol oxidoreductase subunit beta